MNLSIIFVNTLKQLYTTIGEKELNQARRCFIDFVGVATAGGKHLDKELIQKTDIFFDDMPNVRHNYGYFPIFVDAEKYGKTRDELYFEMKDKDVLGRRYFYPLISEFSTYRGLPSATLGNLPNAHKMADTVICLPMHHSLTEEDVNRVLDIVVK